MVKMNLSDVNVPELIADMWEPLNEEQREFLANHFTLQNYKKNEVIHCEGETPKYLMCLLSGKVKIYKDGVGGRSQIIRMIKPVEYFGYRAYFAKEDYVTAAAAFEPSLICLIPMSAITTLVAQNNDLALFFIKQLSIDLGIADERTVNLTQNISAEDWPNRSFSSKKVTDWKKMVLPSASTCHARTWQIYPI